MEHPLDTLQTLVEAFCQCHLNRNVQLQGAAPLMPGLNMATAYQIQAQTVAKLGKPIVGWKLAVATPAAQRQNGLDEPTVGRLLDGALIDGPAMIPLLELNRPVVEPEIALTLAHDIPAGTVLPSPDDALAAIARIQIAIELADTRYITQSDKTQPENVADNCGAAFLILGSEMSKGALLSLNDVRIQLSFQDGSTVPGFDAPDRPDPLQSLMFLTRFLTREGLPLKKGQVITTGTCTPPTPAPNGKTTAHFGPLGAVELTLTH